VKQRRLRLMTAQPLLNNINKMIDIAKMQAFLGGELQLPADALFGKERGPATLPGVRLRVVERSLSKSRPNCG
jgi:hypothetical protein